MDHPLLGRRTVVGASAGLALGLASLTSSPAQGAERADRGVTPRWSPLRIPDCDAWFDASQTAAGAFVTEHFVDRKTLTASSRWSRTGSVAVARGAARMRRGAATSIVSTGVRAPDYAVHATVHLAATAAVVLYPHVRGAGEHLAVTFRTSSGTSSIRVVATVAGRSRLLASTRHTGLGSGGVHRLRVEGRGIDYRVYVDGHHRLTVRVPRGATTASTRAGFGFGDSDTTTRVTEFGVGPATHDVLQVGDRTTALANLADATGGTYAAEASAASAPTFSRTGLGGHPALRFSGTERLTSPITGSPAAATWVAVIQQDEIRAGSFLGTGADGAPDGFEFRVNADGTVTGFRSGVWRIGSSSIPITAARPNIVAFVWDTTGSWSCLVNGEVSGFGYGGWKFHNGTPTTISIGSSTPASVRPFTGLVGEVARWRRVLHGSELRAVHTALAAKWGVTLAPRIAATTPAPLTARKLRGSNISPKLDMYVGGGSVWTTFWRDWDWDWVRFCIDRAKRVGANSIRIIGDVGAVASGDIDQATYDGRQAQVIDYLAANGMRYYPSGFDLHAAADLSGAAIGRQLCSTARLFARNRQTVVGFDLISELATNYDSYGRTRALRLAIDLARNVRRAAPGLPLTVSDPGDLNWGVLSRGTPLDTFRLLAPHLDFFDVHAYVGTKLRPWHLLPYEMSVDRPLVIGEFGEDLRDNGDVAGAAYYRSVRSLRKSSASLAGVFQWAVVEDTCGLWAETGDVSRPHTVAEWRRF